MYFASANLIPLLVKCKYYMKNENQETSGRSHCAISMALEMVGDKWSLLILRDLMFTDKRSYGELQSCDEKIATNILATRLQSLEANGIIRKTTDPKNGRRNLYYLTAKGIDLLPVVLELKHWMEKYSIITEACPNQLPLTGEDQATAIDAYKKQLAATHCVSFEM